MSVATIKAFLAQLNWLLFVFTLLVFAGLIKLGVWQTGRAIEKELRLARIEQLSEANVMSLAQVEEQLSLGEEINDLPISVSGILNASRIFLLDNQVNKGQVGYRVLQVLEVGSVAVLINMGWIAGNKNRAKLPELHEFSGSVTLSGHVRVPEMGISLSAQNYDDIRWPFRVQQIELAKFSQVIGQKMLPFVVYLDTKEKVGYVKNWQPIVMPPEKHRAYAFQWFSLAVAWLLLMFFASVRHFNQHRIKSKDCDVSSEK